MNKKFIIPLIGLIVVIAINVFYFYTRPSVANNYANKAVKVYLDVRNKDGDNSEQYQLALEHIEMANKWGKSDTNLDILKGQLLIALGRYDEAKIHFELVKTNDPSAEMAVDELLKQLP